MLLCYTGRRAGTYKVIRGCVYFDNWGGQRARILSFELDHPDQGPVILLPIFEVA